MPAIRKLQELYLETREQKFIEQLYNGIVALGLTIQSRCPNLAQDSDEVYDIASNVCMRLIETGKPIIRSAPSAYIKLALFYKNKTYFHESLDEAEIASWDSWCENTYDEAVDEILEQAGIDTSKDLGIIVEETLRNRIEWKVVRRCFRDAEARKEYDRMMMEVYRHEKENLQSNRMLSNG